MKLPIKARILEYAIQKNAAFSALELAGRFQLEYKKERTASAKNIEKMIQVYCGVGIMKPAAMALTDDGELRINYVVTDYGRSCGKMLPDADA